VENCVVVEPFTAIVQEVFNGDWRFVSKGVDNDVAVIGVKSDHNNHPAFVSVYS
jgi:hypothetical protein